MGTLTKENVNKRGYNKFLDMEREVNVRINYDKIREDAKWDGLKGYLTNAIIPTEDVYAAYHNLWNVEMAFCIAKSKIEIRPMFHFTRRRIEAHVYICFVALKVYKELERILKLTDIKMSVDKVLALAQTIVTIQIQLPQNKDVIICQDRAIKILQRKCVAGLLKVVISAVSPFFLIGTKLWVPLCLRNVCRVRKMCCNFASEIITKRNKNETDEDKQKMGTCGENGKVS